MPFVCLLFSFLLPLLLPLLLLLLSSLRKRGEGRGVPENFLLARRMYQAKVQEQLAVGLGLSQAPPAALSPPAAGRGRGGSVLGGWEDDDENLEEIAGGVRVVTQEPGSVTGMKYAQNLSPPQPNDGPRISGLPEIDRVVHPSVEETFAAASPPRSDHQGDEQRHRSQQQQQTCHPAPTPLDRGDIDKAFAGAFGAEPEVISPRKTHPKAHL